MSIDESPVIRRSTVARIRSKAISDDSQDEEDSEDSPRLTTPVPLPQFAQLSPITVDNSNEIDNDSFNDIDSFRSAEDRFARSTSKLLGANETPFVLFDGSLGSKLDYVQEQLTSQDIGADGIDISKSYVYGMDKQQLSFNEDDDANPELSFLHSVKFSPENMAIQFPAKNIFRSAFDSLLKNNGIHKPREELGMVKQSGPLDFTNFLTFNNKQKKLKKSVMVLAFDGKLSDQDTMNSLIGFMVVSPKSGQTARDIRYIYTKRQKKSNQAVFPHAGQFMVRHFLAQDVEDVPQFTVSPMHLRQGSQFEYWKLTDGINLFGTDQCIFDRLVHVDSIPLKNVESDVFCDGVFAVLILAIKEEYVTEPADFKHWITGENVMETDWIKPKLQDNIVTLRGKLSTTQTISNRNLLQIYVSALAMLDEYETERLFENDGGKTFPQKERSNVSYLKHIWLSRQNSKFALNKTFLLKSVVRIVTYIRCKTFRMKTDKDSIFNITKKILPLESETLAKNKERIFTEVRNNLRDLLKPKRKEQGQKVEERKTETKTDILLESPSVSKRSKRSNRQSVKKKQWASPLFPLSTIKSKKRPPSGSRKKNANNSGGESPPPPSGGGSTQLPPPDEYRRSFMPQLRF